jgi:hypothetical protein
MKTKCIIYALIIFCTIIINCNASFLGLFGGENIGNGKIGSTEINDLSDFNSIDVNGTFTINIVIENNSNDIKITGDSNLLSIVSTDVKNHTLYISTDDKYKSINPFEIYINLKSLDKLNIKGANTIKVTGIDDKKFTLKQDGVNKITLEGKTNILKLYSTDVGRVYARKLKAQNADISLFDVSTANLSVVHNLVANVRDSSEATYYGDPQNIISLNKWNNDNIIAG